MKNSILAAMALFFTISLTTTAPAHAEMYKYIDENGQTRWTDDLGQVPKEYRETVQSMESVDTESEDADAPNTDQAGDSSLDSPTDESNNDMDSASNASLDPKTLEKERADLDAFYQELQEEKKKIDQLKREAVDVKAQKELNVRISAFNKKTQQYETKLSQFNERVKTYNQQIKNKNN